MKAHELRQMTIDELRSKETELSEQLFAFRVQAVTGQLEKPSKVREAKKNLARVLTVLTEMQNEAGRS